MIGYISHGELSPTHNKKMPQLWSNKETKTKDFFLYQTSFGKVLNALLRRFNVFVW